MATSSSDAATAEHAAQSGTILITGSAGFIGSALAQRLLGAGLRPVGLDLAASDTADFPSIAGDVRDPKLLVDVCRGFGVATIVHAGGVSGRSVGRDDRLGTISTNVQGTANVCEAARRAPVSRVILCSSGSVYGCSAQDPVTEDTVLLPVNTYGASKVAGEAILHAYTAESAFAGVALRIFNAYGPGRRTASPLRTMVEAGLRGSIAEIGYRANARFQFVHIDDVVDALLCAIAAGPTGQAAYNISGARSLSLGEVAATVAEVIPGSRVRFGTDPLSREYCLGEIDISCAARDLGYAPKVGLRDGIAGYAEILRDTVVAS